jgi:hypothetical protein
MRALVLTCLAVALCAPARAEDPAGAFKGFCEEWMHKLEVREHDNVSHIKWEVTQDGVQGDYVGYTHEHTCLTKNGTQSVPVGKITYREIKYEKRGTTIAEAESNPPKAVEVTEVTEIFRYAKGKWVY